METNNPKGSPVTASKHESEGANSKGRAEKEALPEGHHVNAEPVEEEEEEEEEEEAEAEDTTSTELFEDADGGDDIPEPVEIEQYERSLEEQPRSNEEEASSSLSSSSEDSEDAALTIAERVHRRRNGRRETSVAEEPKRHRKSRHAHSKLSQRRKRAQPPKPTRRERAAINYIGTAAAIVISVAMYLVLFRGPDGPVDSPFLDDTPQPQRTLTLTGHKSGWPGHNAKRLFRQYTRMRALCMHVSAELGFDVELARRSLGPSVQSGTALPRPLNGHPNAPFFCMNALLDQFAAGEIYTIHEQQQHRNRAIERLRAVLPTDNVDLARQWIDWISARRDINDHEAPDVMQPFDSIESASNKQLGYLEDAVVARNLVALEDQRAILNLISFSALKDLGLSMHRAPGRYRDSSCVCGLYYGIPRNIVVMRAHNRTSVLLDPEVTRVADSGQYLTSAELPFHTDFHRGYDMRVISDAFMAAAGVDVNSATHYYHDSIDVISVAVSEDENSRPHVSEVRNMFHFSGSKAMCVEHCSHLASAWADTADASHLFPGERLYI